MRVYNVLQKDGDTFHKVCTIYGSLDLCVTWAGYRYGKCELVPITVDVITPQMLDNLRRMADPDNICVAEKIEKEDMRDKKILCVVIGTMVVGIVLMFLLPFAAYFLGGR